MGDARMTNKRIILKLYNEDTGLWENALSGTSGGEIDISSHTSLLATELELGHVKIVQNLDGESIEHVPSQKAVVDAINDTISGVEVYTQAELNKVFDILTEYVDSENANQDLLNSTTYSPIVHTHTIAQINGLQTALDNKSSSTHKHEIADVDTLQTALDSKASAVALTNLRTAFEGHTHEISQVTGLQDILDTTSKTGHLHNWTEITNRPISTASSIDTAVANMHSHSNLDVISRFEEDGGVLSFDGNPLGEVAYLSVPTLTDRDALPLGARKEGLMVMVIEDGSMYYLKGGIDNAFWQIFATGQGGATNATTLSATPTGNLTGTNVQSLLDELELKKANLSDVYTREETKNYIDSIEIDYYTLANTPSLASLHSHDNKETLDLFSQYQGDLTWKGKTLGDLVTEIYDADKDGVIDRASTLNGMTVTVEDLNKLAGISDNIQSQINSIASGSIFRGEYATYADMESFLTTPEKGDWVFILTDETKNGALNTQYLHDGTSWVYGGGSTKISDATSTTKGVIQLGGDLAHPSSTASAPKLTPTGVTAGLYRSANVTVGEDGRISNIEEGNIVFLNDTITSLSETWSSEKITTELGKYSLRNHTHPQLHNANMLGTTELSNDSTPLNNHVISYDATLGKAVWKEQNGGKTYVGSKFVSGDLKIIGGSYVSLALNELTNELTISSTYRETGGSHIQTGFEINVSQFVPAGKSVRFSTESGYNKVMLHTLQMKNDKSASSEVRLYNQAVDGFIEYNSNPEMTISDIVNIPIFDYDNTKQLHIEIVNNGVEDATYHLRMKCTNLL